MNEEKNMKSIYLSRQEKFSRRFSSFFLGFVFVICLIVSSFNIIFYPAEVFGKSMLPTINKQTEVNSNYRDTVYVSSWFGFSKGDIVIVDLPDKTEEGIKRLIATGGDVLSFKSGDNKFYLNGSVLEEKYLEKNNAVCVNKFVTLAMRYISQNNLQGCSITLEDDMYSITLDEGYCIYLGDNRENSYDCSNFGPQKVSTILGKVFLIVPYGGNISSAIFHKIFG